MSISKKTTSGGRGLSMAEVTKKAQSNAKKHSFPAAPPPVVRPTFARTVAPKAPTPPVPPKKVEAKPVPAKAPVKPAPKTDAKNKSVKKSGGHAGLQVQHRSSKTGRIVTPEKAKKNPDTTYKTKVDTSGKLKEAQQAAKQAEKELREAKAALKRSEKALEVSNKRLAQLQAKKSK